MRLGVQYYRVPNPEEKYWAQDFAHMQDIGLTEVRLWIFWSTVNPAKHQWNWRELDMLFDLAARHGLSVVGQLIPEAQPRWFVDEHEELVPRDSLGARSHLLGHTIAAASAYPGITFDHPESQAGMARFMEEVVKRYRSHRATGSWDVWNEIQPFSFSYDQATVRVWQSWLRDRFEEISRFREFTQLDVQDFDAVPLLVEDLPDRGSGTLPFRFLFKQWISQRMTREMARRASAVRTIDSQHSVVSHRRSALFIEPIVDESGLVDELEMWGTSNYQSEYTSNAELADLALNLAMIRGVSGKKPFWLAETTAGRMYHLYGHTLPTAGEIRSSLLLAFAQGASSALLWQFRQERFGQEASGFGLLNFDGSESERVHAVRDVAHALKRIRERGDALARVTSRLALVFDPSVVQLEGSMDQPIPQVASHANELSGWFRAALAAGESAEVLTPSSILRDGIPAGVALVVLPMHTIGNRELAEVLLRWVSDGGTVVQTAFSGMLTPELIAPVDVPDGPMRDALGGRIVARDYPDGSFSIDTTWGALPGHLVVEEMRPGDSDCKNLTWLSSRHGAGVVVHVGTLPGTAHLKGASGLPSWLARILGSSTDSQPAVVSPTAVLIERMSSKSSTSLLAFNSSREPQRISLEPTSEQRQVVDVLNDVATLVNPHEEFHADVAGRDCTWIEVRSV